MQNQTQPGTAGGTTSCHLGWIKPRGWICVDLFPSSRHGRGERGRSRKRNQNLDNTAHDAGMVPRGVLYVDEPKTTHLSLHVVETLLEHLVSSKPLL